MQVQILPARSYTININSPTMHSATIAHPVCFLRGSGFMAMPRDTADRLRPG